MNIVSLGQASALIQAMPSRIIAAADELKIVPASRINCVDYYEESDLSKIAEYLQQRSRSTVGGLPRVTQ